MCDWVTDIYRKTYYQENILDIIFKMPFPKIVDTIRYYLPLHKIPMIYSKPRSSVALSLPALSLIKTAPPSPTSPNLFSCRRNYLIPKIKK